MESLLVAVRKVENSEGKQSIESFYVRKDNRYYLFFQLEEKLAPAGAYFQFETLHKTWLAIAHRFYKDEPDTDILILYER